MSRMSGTLYEKARMGPPKLRVRRLMTPSRKEAPFTEGCVVTMKSLLGPNLPTTWLSPGQFAETLSTVFLSASTCLKPAMVRPTLVPRSYLLFSVVSRWTRSMLRLARLSRVLILVLLVKVFLEVCPVARTTECRTHPLPSALKRRWKSVAAAAKEKTLPRLVQFFMVLSRPWLASLRVMEAGLTKMFPLQ